MGGMIEMLDHKKVKPMYLGVPGDKATWGTLGHIDYIDNILGSREYSSNTLDILAGNINATTSFAMGINLENKGYHVGAYIRLAEAADPDTIWMVGRITEYDNVSGATTIVVTSSAGNGTYGSWIIDREPHPYNVVFDNPDPALKEKLYQTNNPYDKRTSVASIRVKTDDLDLGRGKEAGHTKGITWEP